MTIPGGAATDDGCTADVGSIPPVGLSRGPAQPHRRTAELLTEVVEMAVGLVIVTCALVALIVGAAWPAMREEAAGHNEAASSAPRSDTSPATSDPDTPASLEGVLVVQLADGAITRDQYLRAMEFIAVRDAGRNPLSVPSDE